MAGLFITFEGVEGCGKSTQIDLLENWLMRRRRVVKKVIEPGGTKVGDRLRDILLDPDSRGVTAQAEALMYAASRAQLVADVIRPALEAEQVVLSDRYLDSSLAYQVYGRGLDFEQVMSINKWATDSLLPDMTFLLRLTAEIGLGRTIGRQADRLEQESLDFHRLVEAGYEDLAAKYAERYVVVDARESIEHIHRQVVKAAEQII